MDEWALGGIKRAAHSIPFFLTGAGLGAARPYALLPQTPPMLALFR
jgi:hypothetical protein